MLSGFSVHEDSPGKNTGVGCHALLQEIFPTQGLTPGLLCLLHWQVSSSPLAPPGKDIEMWKELVQSHESLQRKRTKQLVFKFWIISQRNATCTEELDSYFSFT